MNRTIYFNFILERLITLSSSIETKGKLNILDLHVHSENFYLHLFNELFGWNLENLNAIKQNIESIDLIDRTPNKIIIQVSATATKTKIESALEKAILKSYTDHNFKFISISKDASDLRTKTYNNPYNVTFNPSTDIYDIPSILNHILSLDIDRQKRIYGLIKKELGNDVDTVKIDLNLAVIINILSEERLGDCNEQCNINPFEIERKIKHNNLTAARYIIKEYYIHYERIDGIYSEFDKSGVNKSMSVLQGMRHEYIKNSTTKTGDDLFYTIVDETRNKILQSSNYKEIAMDELELCINILVVDAFIRCKIFENPNNYQHQHVTTG